MQKQLYFFRHGQTDFNKQNRIQGRIDIPLNEVGIEQALKLLDKLKKLNIEYIISSPLKRSLKTAEIFAEENNLNIEIIDNLIEADCGDFEGMLIDDVLSDEKNKIIRHNFKSIDPKFLDCRHPNGESKKEIRNRINNLKKYFANSKFKTIGISTHGFVMRELFVMLNEIDPLTISNCEIFSVLYDCDKKSFLFKERI